MCNTSCDKVVENVVAKVGGTDAEEEARWHQLSRREELFAHDARH